MTTEQKRKRASEPEEKKKKSKKTPKPVVMISCPSCNAKSDEMELFQDPTNLTEKLCYNCLYYQPGVVARISLTGGPSFNVVYHNGDEVSIRFEGEDWVDVSFPLIKAFLVDFLAKTTVAELTVKQQTERNRPPTTSIKRVEAACSYSDRLYDVFGRTKEGELLMPHPSDYEGETQTPYSAETAFITDINTIILLDRCRTFFTALRNHNDYVNTWAPVLVEDIGDDVTEQLISQARMILRFAENKKIDGFGPFQ